MVKNDRQLIFDSLLKVYRDKGYSNLTLGKILSNPEHQSTNAFITAVFYGVIERDITLEYIINLYSKRKCDKLDNEILIILKMGLYQLKYMDSVPDNAAVDESVKLCYYVKKASAKGLVNAVLRSFIRDDKKISVDGMDNITSLSINYSCPKWLIEKWAKQYSLEVTKKLLEYSVGRPPVTVRVNTLKITMEDLIDSLNKKGIECEINKFTDNCLSLYKTGDISALSEFKNGFFYVQDIASQLCARAVSAKPESLIYDMCSAPGSKSFTMSQYMKNSGMIMAFDLYEHKIKLIEASAARLGITNIKTRIGDAAEYSPDLVLADRVLCDVPCSGLGIIRRKPEIKYKPEAELKNLPQIQYNILKNCSNYVKHGGLLIYSTCSVDKDENQYVAKKFLEQNSEFEAYPLPDYIKSVTLYEDNMATFMPYIINSDGFFIATFKRK